MKDLLFQISTFQSEIVRLLDEGKIISIEELENISDSNDIKYVDTLERAQVIPIAVAKCVLPTPLEPTNKIFSLLSRKPILFSSRSSFLLIPGWKSNSKSSIVFMNGKPAVLTQAFSARIWLLFCSSSISSSRASLKDF